MARAGDLCGRTLPSDGAYFDQLIKTTGDFNPFSDRGWETLRRAFARASGGATGLDILDVGCGTGQSRRIYGGQSGSYVGVDLSIAALQLASHRDEVNDWVQADALQLPFRAGSFDVVAFSSVLHHVSDLDGALRSAMAVLRPGGLVFAFDPNLLHPAMLLFRHPSSPLYRSEGVSPSERPLLPRVVARAFERCGLEGVELRGQSDIPYRHIAPRGLNRFLPLYNAADWAWEKCGAGRWFGTFVVSWGRTPL